ncbi:MAG TPA: signal peptidase I [Candidatus Sulfotelmatobacter sp.]|nr:signal peptidase I [Candidatus Sulfotelmatobacter sp.]
MDRRQWGCLFEVLETLVLTIVIFLLIQNFVAQPYQVEQQSMEHTLEPGQYVLVDKLTPRFADYQRGDIIVFTPPGTAASDPTQVPFIKRIIGLPGDRIEFRNGDVFVNGVQLDEPYVYDGQPTTAGAAGSTVVVPAGEYFGLGDHRENSTDSRVFGFIPRGNIIGRAWLRYWPINDLGILSTPVYANVPPAGSAFDPSGGLAVLSFGLAAAALAGGRTLRARIG